ncbi:MAG: single-stranded-DNA-specific exonuclease RecJ [Desulfobacterales bacterium GWB2_56_26]|nr:MAG: single-stranded-DNA-specific exonuclease RecJ [Desulfobacterales bacterium GWB2_56_26]
MVPKKCATTDSESREIPHVFNELLKKRGVVGEEMVRRFLYPRLSDLPQPQAMKNLPEAVRLVVQCITSGKQIVVWGDYDVDGTTGTALMVNFFREFGVDVLWHIPNRLTEGYGLNTDWFLERRKIDLSKDFLLITVDCGISNAPQIELIQRIGGTVIVTDHHNIPENGLPSCLILNPAQAACGFHREHLAGVGVVFYLAAGIRTEYCSRAGSAVLPEKMNLKKYLALVALGTIADVVDLTATNRILVRAGLEALAETTFPGLQELLISCDICKGDITSEDIGYLIGPKINAAGRLGESDLVVNILTAKSRKEAKGLVQKLTELNELRRRITADSLETALSIIRKYHAEDNKCLIVKGELHQGVAGIVAARLVEMYGVPSIVFAKKNTPDGSVSFVGSARSIEGMHILDMINVCSKWVDRYGGHEMAAGLSISLEKMADFELAFVAAAQDKWEQRSLVKKRRFDVECSVDQLMTTDYIAFFKLLEPFGPGNLQPIFYDNSVRIVDSKTVGKDSEHLHLTIRGKYANLKGIGFSLGGRIDEVQKVPERSILFVPIINRFRGNISWQVRVIDL